MCVEEGARGPRGLEWVGGWVAVCAHLWQQQSSPQMQPQQVPSHLSMQCRV